MPFNGHSYGAQVIIDLLMVASYACVLVASVLLRKTPAFLSTVNNCVERITPGRSQLRLGFWGLAIAITIPWIAVELFKTRVLGILGLAMFPVAIGLMGTAVAITSEWIQSALQTSELSDGERSPRLNGTLVFALASAMPVLGWFIMALCILPSLGATAEYLISGGQKTRSHHTLIGADGSAELVSTKSSEDAA